MPQPKQTTMVSRSFGMEVRDYDELANAIAMFATDAARSIRRANLVSTSVSVFIETNRFGKSPHHAPSRSEALSPATNNTKHVVRAALTALKRIYREGLARGWTRQSRNHHRRAQSRAQIRKERVCVLQDREDNPEYRK